MLKEKRRKTANLDKGSKAVPLRKLCWFGKWRSEGTGGGGTPCHTSAAHSAKSAVSVLREQKRPWDGDGDG